VNGGIGKRVPRYGNKGSYGLPLRILQSVRDVTTSHVILKVIGENLLGGAALVEPSAGFYYVVFVEVFLQFF
jgi:hypothetical protein